MAACLSAEDDLKEAADGDNEDKKGKKEHNPPSKVFVQLLFTAVGTIPEPHQTPKHIITGANMLADRASTDLEHPTTLCVCVCVCGCVCVCVCVCVRGQGEGLQVLPEDVGQGEGTREGDHQRPPQDESGQSGGLRPPAAPPDAWWSHTSLGLCAVSVLSSLAKNTQPTHTLFLNLVSSIWTRLRTTCLQRSGSWRSCLCFYVHLTWGTRRGTVRFPTPKAH